MTKFVQNPDSEENIARWGLNLSATEELDDWSSEWQEVLQGKGVWGGRKRGGRGVQRITGQTKDISVEGLTLAFCGRELLQRTSLKLVAGHRYGLIGENGVGKSTLLRRMAKQTIPGIPLHFRFGYVQQELLVSEDCSVLDYVLSRVGGATGGVDEQLNTLRDEEADLEAEMEKETDNERLGQLAEQLCEVVEQIEVLERQSAEKDDRKKLGQDDGEITRASIEALGPKVVEVLDGLGLSKPPARLSLRLSELSGGWRMRAALAQVLIQLSKIDVLLLDEPTNHLDLPSIAWLQSYLSSTSAIILFVSHDRSFLSSVATDIIEMKSLALSYFAGTYEDYLLHSEEMRCRAQNAVDSRVRKETHIQKSIDQARSRGDDSMAKSKQKKLERAAFTRNIDGHKFKLFSLSKMDEKSLRMPEIYDPNPHFAPSENVNPFHANKFKLPAVDAAALRLPAPNAPLLTLEKVSLSYQSPAASGGASKALLEEVTLQLGLGSRVGILGRNGTGKSSLLAALANANGLGPVKAINTESNASSGNGKVLTVTGGQVWRHHQLRIGVVAQHQIDILSNFLFHTPITYMQHLLVGSGLSYNEQELRSHLGAFGLTGSLALQQVGSLSGGQKARLSFAAVCLLRPQLLFLDEPSNHLSMESIEALIKACQEFTGGLVVVSHNRYLLQQVCNELFFIAKKGPVKSGAAGKGGAAIKKGGKAAAVASPAASSSEGKGPVYTVSVRKVVQTETAGQSGDNGVSVSSSGSIDHSAMYTEEQRQAFSDLLDRAIAEQMNS